MMAPDQIHSIAAEIAAIDQLPHGERLEYLKARAMETGGTWDLPSKLTGVYDPLIKTIQIHGITGMADELDELAKNWTRAARNTLDAYNEAVAIDAVAAA